MGTTPHTHDKFHGFGHKKAPPRNPETVVPLES